MIECLVLGDSIAHGVAQLRRECSSDTVVGISSRNFIPRVLSNTRANSVLISLGSNDGNSNTYENLKSIRQRIVAYDVLWLVSANNEQAARATIRVASEHGDRIAYVSPWIGRDGVHPTPSGYSRLSQIWRGPR